MKDKTKKYKKRLNKSLKGGSAPSGYTKNGLFVAYTPEQRYMIHLEMQAQAQAEAQAHAQAQMQAHMYAQMQAQIQAQMQAQMMQAQMYPYASPMGQMMPQMMPYPMGYPYQMMTQPQYNPYQMMPQPQYNPYQMPQPMSQVVPQAMSQPMPQSVPQSLSVSAVDFVPKKSSKSPKSSTPKRSKSPKDSKSPKRSNSLPTSVPNSLPISVPNSLPISVPNSLPISVPNAVPLVLSSPGVSGVADNSPPIPSALTRQITVSRLLNRELRENPGYKAIMNTAMGDLRDYQLGKKDVYLRRTHPNGFLRIVGEEIFFNWDDDRGIQKCHISLHSKPEDTSTGLNEIVGSLHVRLDDKHKTAKRICVFYDDVYEIAIYEEEMDPMKYKIIDRFAADVVEVLLNYYASTGRPAQKVDTSRCKK
jgi:hypothetical protein